MFSHVGEGGSRALLEAVNTLIRPQLAYNPDDENYRKIAGRKNIVGTHGANTDAVLRLARSGRFSGGSAKKFYMTPNHDYGKWDNPAIPKEIGETVMKYSIDSFLVSIGYSEIDVTDPNEELDPDDYTLDHHGVVIAFNSRVFYGKPDIHEDLILEHPELVLPHAPVIETIEGIYPVDESVEVQLVADLQAIADQLA